MPITLKSSLDILNAETGQEIITEREFLAPSDEEEETDAESDEGTDIGLDLDALLGATDVDEEPTIDEESDSSI